VAFDQREDGSGNLVTSINSINLGTEYAPKNNLAFGLEMPIHQLNFYRKGETFALGDARLFSKINLTENFLNHGIKLSAIPSAYIPTGNNALYLSNTSGGAGFNLSAEKRLGSYTILASAGADHFPHASYGNVNYQNQLLGGLGVKKSISERWSLQFEAFGREIKNIRTGDFYLGSSCNLSQDRKILFGASLASTDFKVDPSYRLMLGFQWTPTPQKVITERVHTKVETVQKIKTVYDCGPRKFSQSYLGRALTEAEKRAYKTTKPLPYVSQPSRPMGTLRLGGKNAMTDQGIFYVENAQVLFAVDVPNLPNRESVISVKNLDLVIEINKLWKGEERGTDILCLLEQKVCSGDVPTQKPDSENINYNFFEGKEPPNDFFIRQLSVPPRTDDVGVRLSQHKLKLPIEKLIENSVFGDKLSFIYPTDGSTPNGKTLYFSVANNIYVHPNVRLNVELSVQVCTATSPKPMRETIHQESKVLEEGPVNE